MQWITALRLILFMVSCLPLYPALAYEPDFKIINNEISYEINSDSSFIYREHFIIQVINQAGVERLSQYPIPYSDSLQTVRVLDAYTETAEGETLKVGKDGIVVQQSPASSRAPTFSDVKIMHVVFPGVEPGARLHLVYERKQESPLFPGHFSAIEKFDVTHSYESAQLTVTAPDSYPLNVEAIDIDGGEVSSGIPGKKMWRWKITGTAALSPELGSVSMRDVSPRIVISSFTSYPEISEAYLALAAGKAEVTPSIQKLAKKITEGVEDKKEQAEALYNWVTSNIRYVAIFIQYGGVVPEDADTVLKARYGDCKGHAILLQALLAAKGIESHQILVNAANEYWLPKTVAAPDSFNHVLTYLPELDLYVDSTLKGARFGTLSPLEIGKQALLTHPDPSRARLTSIPVNQGDVKNHESVFTEVEISNAGHVTVKRRVTTSGALELIAKNQLAQIPRGRGNQLVTAMLRQMGQNGSGSIEVGDLHNIHDPLTYHYLLKFPDYIDLSESGPFLEPMGIPSQSGIVNFAMSMSMEERRFPVPCLGALLEEETVVHIPRNITVKALPENREAETSHGTYKSEYSYSSEKNAVAIKRKLELDPPAVCDAQSYRLLRKLATEIAPDLRAQILFSSI